MAVPWGPGARVKMAVETEEPLRTAWYHGTICCNGNEEFDRWGKSLWRMLQVNWDEPEVLQNIKAVNPWQVELVSSTSSYPVMKRLKLMDTNRLSLERQEDMILVTGLTSSPFNLNESPIGTQEPGIIYLFFSTNFVPESTKQTYTNNAGGINAWNLVTTRSTFSTPEDGSNVDQPGMEFCVTDACKPTKLSKGTIQLFGKIIHSTETNVSTDFSLSFPHKLLLESQSRLTAVGACK
ncbi:hypothetical protein HPP92_013759 [Vanilla planifolia]|uniref:Auxin response factor domain-containing protein n=1 Tax=Vanilla planifolia TaxID=51239 RepID=A0A835UWZ6_VANPL|nr:hypothetical protein HPP92_013759 [Vanilla planifolia]